MVKLFSKNNKTLTDANLKTYAEYKKAFKIINKHLFPGKPTDEYICVLNEYKALPGSTIQIKQKITRIVLAILANPCDICQNPATEYESKLIDHSGNICCKRCYK